MENNQRINEIKVLTERLNSLINEVELINGNNNNISDNFRNMSPELLDKLDKLNVSVEHVRKIIKRCDEVYGRTSNFRTSTPLYEENGKFNSSTMNGNHLL